MPRGVRRALEAMRANVGHDWTVADLAAAAGQSGRTLQRQFKVFLGKTPWTVLTDLRFEAARRELLLGLPETKMMDVALRHGFSHYGRFSVEYRRRFDETPSTTLKRQLTFADALASMPAVPVTSRERPTVAIGAIDSVPRTEDAARSVADELATALSRAGIAVTSDPRSARYRLGGSLRMAGEQKRLTLRLLDGETGTHLWAHRYDGAFGDEIDPAEHVAVRIAVSLQPSLRRAEIDRAQRKSERDLTAHDLTLRAMPGILSLDADGNARGLDLLERATDRDPQQPLALALSAWAHVQRVTYHFTTKPEQERIRAIEIARKAQAMADEASALAVLGNAFTLLHDLDAAELVVPEVIKGRSCSSCQGGEPLRGSDGLSFGPADGGSQAGICPGTAHPGSRHHVALHLTPAAYTIGLTPPPAGDVKPAAVRVPRTGVVRLHLTVQPTP